MSNSAFAGRTTLRGELDCSLTQGPLDISGDARISANVSRRVIQNGINFFESANTNPLSLLASGFELLNLLSAEAELKLEIENSRIEIEANLAEGIQIDSKHRNVNISPMDVFEPSSQDYYTAEIAKIIGRSGNQKLILAVVSLDQENFGIIGKYKMFHYDPETNTPENPGSEITSGPTHLQCLVEGKDNLTKDALLIYRSIYKTQGTQGNSYNFSDLY